MAPPTQNKTAIRADIVEVYIDTIISPFTAQVTLDGPNYVTTPIVPANLGESIGELINSRGASGTLILQQSSIDELRQFCEVDTAAGANQYRALPVGSFLPTHKMRLHDPQAQDNNGDIIFFAVTFGAVKATIDGQGERLLEVPWKAQRHTDGTFWQIKADA